MAIFNSPSVKNLFLIFMTFSLFDHAYAQESPKADCNKEFLQKFENKTDIWIFPGGKALFFKSGMAVDADGAPNAYDPENKRGIDFLGNAGKPAKNGKPANWWAIATDNGKPDGNPLIQKDGPYKGFYISQTSLRDSNRPDNDVKKYVDATQIPYFVLPSKLAKTGKVKLGDVGMVIHAKTGALNYAIFADFGPARNLGEGSIALAKALGIPTDLRRKKAGTLDGVIYLIFPGTTKKPAWPRSISDLKTASERAFGDWGGMAQIKACYPEYNLNR